MLLTPARRMGSPSYSSTISCWRSSMFSLTSFGVPPTAAETAFKTGAWLAVFDYWQMLSDQLAEIVYGLPHQGKRFGAHGLRFSQQLETSVLPSTHDGLSQFSRRNADMRPVWSSFWRMPKSVVARGRACQM